MYVKTFFSLETAFLVIGTIIGSGFVSGREIVVFFGGNVFIAAFIAGAAFFLTTFLLLETGRNFGDLGSANAKFYGRANKTVGAGLTLCMFAVAAAGTATADAIGSSLFGIPKNIPVFSVLSLAAVFFCAKKGIKGLRLVNTALVPIMLVTAAALIFAKGGFDFSPSGVKSMPVTYTSFNMFISAAVVAEAGAGGTRKSSLIASFISSVITVIYVLLIYGSVNYEGANALNADLPLYYTVSCLGKGAAGIFAAVLFIGAFTSLVSAYYPLGKSFVSVFGKRGDVTAALCIFAVSRLGIKNIVAYCYPAAGILGLIYFVSLACFLAYKTLQKSKQ